MAEMQTEQKLSNSIPLVSVVVPVFNTEQYLGKCIDSLIGQTMENIEIILIDDGSNDGSGDVCERYAEEDDRIRVIHKENMGLSAARNDGIRFAKAEYVMFVDSDDWVEPQFCEIPYNKAVNNNADVVMFGKTVMLNGRKQPLEVSLNDEIVTRHQAMDLIHRPYFGCAAWNKLYHKKVFEGIEYPVGKKFEDMATTYRIIDRAERIACIKEELYNYTVSRQGSISSNPSFEETVDRAFMMNQKYRNLEKMGYDVSDYYRRDAFLILIRIGHIAGVTEELESAAKAISIPPAEYDWQKKALLMVYKICPRLFDGICIVMRKRIPY